MLPLVSLIVNTSPRWRTRCPSGASARLSLPSQRGCWAGSAINSKIRPGAAAISRLALTTRGASCSVVMRPSKQPAGRSRMLTQHELCPLS